MEIKGTWFYINDRLEETNQTSPIINIDFNTVYEVLRVYNGKPLFLKEHLDRLKNSFLQLDMDLFLLDSVKIEQKIFQLIRVNQITNGNIRIEFSAEKRSDFKFIYFIPHNYPEDQLYDNGIKVVSYSIERNAPQIKQSKINNFIREKIAAIKKKTHAYEVVLVDKNGCITEGSKSNILFVCNKIIYTTPKKQILEGITRKVVLDLALKNGFEIVERTIALKEINQFEACFITSTSTKILPIAQFDHLSFNHKHQTIQKLLKEYNSLIDV